MFSRHQRQHLYHLFRAVDVRVYVASNLLAVFYYICGIKYVEVSYIRRSNTNYMFPARQTCMIRIETLSAYHAILAPVPHRNSLASNSIALNHFAYQLYWLSKYCPFEVGQGRPITTSSPSNRRRTSRPPAHALIGDQLVLNSCC